MSGSMQQRPDQGSQPPPGVIAPTQAAGILRARTVIISGSGANIGLFEYSGTPALGNPPLLAIVPPGVTTDPFGNALAGIDILMQGNIITEAGGIFRTAAAAPLVQIDGPHDAILLYDAGGSLILTGAPVATSDGLGNTVFRGWVTRSVNAVAQLDIGQLNIFTVGDPANATIIGGGGALDLNSGAGITGRAQAALNLLQSLSAAGAPRIVAGSNSSDAAVLQFAQGAGVPLTSDLNGAPSLTWLPSRTHISQIDAQGQEFLEGHATLFSTTDQLVNSTVFATVCGSIAAGIGTYRIRAVLQVTQGAVSDVNKFRLGFTGTISQVRMGATYVGFGGVANSVFAVQTTSNNGALNPPAFAIGANYRAEFDGLITTTSAGTLGIQAAETTSGDTFTVLALSFFHAEPVT